MTRLLIIAVVILAPPALVGWWLSRAFIGACNIIDEPDDDVFCPERDGTDILDWGDDEWHACNGCKMLFRWPRPR